MTEQKSEAKVDNVGSSRQVFMVRNPKNKEIFVLAINDNKQILTSQNFKLNGWEGLRIEQSSESGVYFITSNKDPSKVLACDNNGKLHITGNRVVNGWEGWKLEHANNNIYFIVSNKHRFVLAINNDGVVRTTKNRVANGWEGIQILSIFRSNSSQKTGIFIRSNKQNKQLAID
eukprot:543125_1